VRHPDLRDLVGPLRGLVPTYWMKTPLTIFRRARQSNNVPLFSRKYLFSNALSAEPTPPVARTRVARTDPIGANHYTPNYT
jgi:hypothetical protein